MGVSERKTMIRRDYGTLSLTLQCWLLRISRSALYCRPIGFDNDTRKLMREIDHIFTEYPFFGNRQITVYLPGTGHLAGRQRVRR